MFPINSNGSFLEMKHFTKQPGSCRGQDQPAPPVLRNFGDSEQVTWLRAAQASVGNVPEVDRSPSLGSEPLLSKQRQEDVLCSLQRWEKVQNKRTLPTLRGRGQAGRQLLRKSRTASSCTKRTVLPRWGGSPRAAASSQLAKVHPLEY